MGWDLSTHLMATLIEVSDETNQILAKVYGKKNAQLPKPLRIERPGKRTQKQKPLKGEALVSALKRKMKLVGGTVEVERTQ